MIAKVHGGRQLAHDGRAGGLYLWNNCGRQFQVGGDALQRHSGPRGFDIFIFSQGIKISPEVSHLDQLYLGAADMIQNLRCAG